MIIKSSTGRNLHTKLAPATNTKGPPCGRPFFVGLVDKFRACIAAKAARVRVEAGIARAFGGRRQYTYSGFPQCPGVASKPILSRMNTRVKSSRFNPATHFSGLLVLLLGICVDPTVGLAQIERISLSPEGLEFARSSIFPSLSDDGRYVTFTSNIQTPNEDIDYLFLHDRQTATTRVVAQSFGYGRLNADGRYMAYGVGSIYVLDLQSGLRELVSISSDGLPGNGGSYTASISADGRFVAFASEANNLVPDDTNGTQDVFVHDRDLGTTERVSVNSAGVQGNQWSESPSISADGYSVAFLSHASNLVANDTNGQEDVFVHDGRHGATERASISSSGAQAELYSFVRNGSISADGQRVVFGSEASNLVPGDTNGRADVFVRDRATQTTRRVNVGPGGAQANDHANGFPVISANGRYVACASRASNLVPGDSNNETDLFVHDLETGATTRVNFGYDGRESNGHTGFWTSLSAEGRIVAFSSYADNLVPGDTNDQQDIFVATLDMPMYVSLVGVPDLQRQRIAGAGGGSYPERTGRVEVLIRDSATKQALGTVGFVEPGLPFVDLAAVRGCFGRRLSRSSPHCLQAGRSGGGAAEGCRDRQRERALALFRQGLGRDGRDWYRQGHRWAGARRSRRPGGHSAGWHRATARHG